MASSRVVKNGKSCGAGTEIWPLSVFSEAALASMKGDGFNVRKIYSATPGKFGQRMMCWFDIQHEV